MACKTKYRKYHKGLGIVKKCALATSGNKLSMDSKTTVSLSNKGIASIAAQTFGVKAISCGAITAEQIETARRILSRRVKSGRYWIRVCANFPVTAKPIEVRMGKGKGSIEYWATRIYKGKILFEFDSVSEATAHIISKAIGHKLPISVQLTKSEATYT